MGTDDVFLTPDIFRQRGFFPRSGLSHLEGDASSFFQSFREMFAQVLHPSTSSSWNGMEMDSHGGLEVTIRQTESKKKQNYPQLRETDP